MVSHSMPNAGDIILVDFDPACGHEEKKTRPALVLTSKFFNDRCAVQWVLPISNTPNTYPLHVDLPKQLQTKGKVLCQQISALDLKARGFVVIEQVPDVFLKEIKDIINKIIIDE